MLQTEKIIEIVKKLEPKLIEERRRFHINAELSGAEFETAAYIVSEMSLLGLKPVWVREPVSAYFVLDTGKEGKTVAFRADIDALPVYEDEYNLKQKKHAVSKNAGVSHACGHDGHTAMLLAIARAITEHQDSLCGRFIFFFESGEEMGPKLDTSTPFVNMLKELKADVIWGMHLCSFMDYGKISVQAGARMAMSGRFEVTIKGRGGHGATPHLSINPLNAAADIASALSKDIQKGVSADQPFSIAVTSIQGGEVWNIIPETCLLKGTFRCCSQEIYESVSEQIHSIVDAFCVQSGCTYEFTYKPGVDEFIPVINDGVISTIAEKAMEKILPGVCADEPAWMASESFGKYQKIVPGVFAFVGIRNEALGSGAGHHNSKFDMDERALSLGVLATLQFVSDFLYQN